MKPGDVLVKATMTELTREEDLHAPIVMYKGYKVLRMSVDIYPGTWIGKGMLQPLGLGGAAWRPSLVYTMRICPSTCRAPDSDRDHVLLP